MGLVVVVCGLVLGFVCVVVVGLVIGVLLLCLG